MKKIYTLIALAISSLGFSQPFTETFDTSTATASYANGSFVGVEDITYTYIHSRDQGTGTDDYSIEGNGLMFRRVTEPSSITMTYPSGLSQFSFQYRKAFTGGTARKMKIFVNDELVEETAEYGAGSGANATVYTYTMPVPTISLIDNTNAVTVRIEISSTGSSSQTTIDNIIWAPHEPQVVNPSASFSVESLNNFEYVFGEGPSETQTVDVIITDLPATETATLASLNTDFIIVSPTALANGTHTIIVQLAADLPIAEYTSELILTHNSVELGSVSLNGEVTEDLSTKENNIEGLNIFPNPANDILNITSNSTADKNVQLFDLTGKKVLDVTTVSQVNVSTLKSGIYVAKIKEAGKTATRKVIIK